MALRHAEAQQPGGQRGREHRDEQHQPRAQRQPGERDERHQRLGEGDRVGPAAPAHTQQEGRDQDEGLGGAGDRRQASGFAPVTYEVAITVGDCAFARPAPDGAGLTLRTGDGQGGTAEVVLCYGSSPLDELLAAACPG